METTDTIQIYVTEDTYRVLMHDAMHFEFLKEGLSINKNAFLTKLITNYYDEYERAIAQAEKKISSVLPKNDPSIGSIDLPQLIRDQIVDLPSDQKKEKRIVIKPTRTTRNIFESIKQKSSNNRKFSDYFRKMFVTYSRHPMYDRERIIFMDSYDAISEAITNRESLSVCLRNDVSGTDPFHHITPYKLCIGQDELHYYLLCAETLTASDQLTRVFRLDRILPESVHTAPYKKINAATTANLKRSEKEGAQHAINSDQTILVRLDKTGLDLYKRIYMDRPQYRTYEEDGNDHYLMTLTCAEDQAFTYFRRFGKSAVVLSPQSLKDRMHDFFSFSLNSYSNDK